MERKANQDALLWGLVGCGVILLLVLFGSCAFGMYVVGTRGMPDFPRRSEAPTPPPSGTSPSNPSPPVPPGKPPPAQTGPVRLRVAVTSVTGSLSGRVMTACDVTVAPPTTQGAMCHALVVCDGLPVYGDGSHGFFPCEMTPDSNRVVGNDGNTTADDGDAAFMVDTDARVFRLRDDASSPNGEYTLVGAP